MEVAEALAALQLGPGATWNEIRARYRRLLRAHHPDLTPDPGAADRTARLTAAYAVLQKATDGGRRPLPAPRATPEPRPARRAAPAEPSGDALPRTAPQAPARPVRSWDGDRPGRSSGDSARQPRRWAISAAWTRRR